MEKLITTVVQHIDWLTFGFVGVVLAVLRADTSVIGKKEVFTTLLSGLVCCFLLPALLKGYFEIDNDAALYFAAFCGGLLGMRIVAALHRLDVERLVRKRLGGE